MKKLNIIKQDVKIQVELSLAELGTITALVGVSTSETRDKANSYGRYKIITDNEDVVFYESLVSLYKQATD